MPNPHDPHAAMREKKRPVSWFRKNAKDYIEAQIATMEKYGSITQVSPAEYYALIDECQKIGEKLWISTGGNSARISGRREMIATTHDDPKKVLIFEEYHEGYWTGDCECACFNPISPLRDERTKADYPKWDAACTYIELNGLDPTKKYRVKLTVEAEEIEP